MSKSLMRVHRDIEREKTKREIMRVVEDKMLSEMVMGMKGIFLLALKKEGWGKTRALRLWSEVENAEHALIDGDITWEDIFSQVKEEYGLELEYREVKSK